MALPPIWPVILSGGAGSRLWPLSRQHLPKQFLALAGSDTMIRATAARVADSRRYRPPVVVTGAGQAALVSEQLGDTARLLVEPSARNTAPAIALAALAVAAEDPAGLVLVMPSDHRIAAPAAFEAAIDAAAPFAADGWLITFGIRAATPETGYGYIEAGETLGPGVLRAASFVEKPDRERARGYVASGHYSWNSGIFLFSAAAMLAALEAHAPDVVAAVRAAATAGSIHAPDPAAWHQATAISIDHAVFEHAARVAVCPVDPGWSDIGSWDALHGLGVADEAGNVTDGEVVLIDSQGCLVEGHGPLVATIGVNNLNIIATPDAVLVTARGRSQQVKDVVTRLSGPVTRRPLLQRHPWGDEHVVHDGTGIAVRRVTLLPDAEIATRGGQALLLAGTAAGDGASLSPGRATACASVRAGADGATLLLIGDKQLG